MFCKERRPNPNKPELSLVTDSIERKKLSQLNEYCDNTVLIYLVFSSANSSDFYEVDHDKKCYWKESIKNRFDKNLLITGFRVLSLIFYFGKSKLR